MNWGYISGFFDGEGYITFLKVRFEQEKTPCLGFTNNEINILQEIQEFIYLKLGIRGFICGRKPRKLNYHSSYDLKYTHLPKILKIINKLVLEHNKKKFRCNLIKTKLQQITPRNGKYTEEMFLKRKQFEQEFFSVL